MDILLIDEKIKNNLIFTEKTNLIKEIEELEKVLEYLTVDKYILKCEKQLVEKRELQEKCMTELKFYFLDTSHIIEKYKKILSKPILRSNENKREKSDIVKEYIKIVNLKYKEAFYHKIDILEIVTLKEKPPSHKIETLNEYEKLKKSYKTKKSKNRSEILEEHYEIVKKLKKAAKTKKILISHEDKYFEKDKFHSMIDVDEILYYESDNTITCKICNGINLLETDDFITCEDCGHFTERIIFVSSYSDEGRVNKRISKSKKK